MGICFEKPSSQSLEVMWCLLRGLIHLEMNHFYKTWYVIQNFTKAWRAFTALVAGGASIWRISLLACTCHIYSSYLSSDYPRWVKPFSLKQAKVLSHLMRLSHKRQHFFSLCLEQVESVKKKNTNFQDIVIDIGCIVETFPQIFDRKTGCSDLLKQTYKHICCVWNKELFLHIKYDCIPGLEPTGCFFFILSDSWKNN